MRWEKDEGQSGAEQGIGVVGFECKNLRKNAILGSKTRGRLG